MALAKVCKSWDSERAESNDICLSAAVDCIPSNLMRGPTQNKKRPLASGPWMPLIGGSIWFRSAQSQRMQRLVRLPNMALSGLSAAPSHS